MPVLYFEEHLIQMPDASLLHLNNLLFGMPDADSLRCEEHSISDAGVHKSTTSHIERNRQSGFRISYISN